jgi:hypothetical protein
LIGKTYAFWKAKSLLFARRLMQGLPDTAGVPSPAFAIACRPAGNGSFLSPKPAKLLLH